MKHLLVFDVLLHPTEGGGVSVLIMLLMFLPGLRLEVVKDEFTNKIPTGLVLFIRKSGVCWYNPTEFVSRKQVDTTRSINIIEYLTIEIILTVCHTIR
jgi:hypothetical protein